MFGGKSKGYHISNKTFGKCKKVLFNKENLLDKVTMVVQIRILSSEGDGQTTKKKVVTAKLVQAQVLFS